ncbi:ribokinase [Lacimicrobium alkaliphilum]|uniref:Ribokinase n=1 Tax=Lacimicrobium alkaliphilum TaxID=1526571 RepID=A0ABQ1RB15_9ALTE|nr:ribokinase [Lacimicrobium alkaliphilum]GGD62494.1 ribokinase [Lacimicrobium alkaliphilum]
MTIFNLGSINWDHCYQVPHFVRPGETLNAQNYTLNLGGKGANQSVAASKAGASVKHIGAVAQGDTASLMLNELGIDISGIEQQPGHVTGHAIIQIDSHAENAIVLHAGANRLLNWPWVQEQLSKGGPGDWLLMQNETNLLEQSARFARERGMRVAFNPAPMDKSVTLRLLPELDLLIVNQVELQDLSEQTELELAIEKIQRQCSVDLLITLGSQGALYVSASERNQVKAFSVKATDTTAAGDTFIGYFLASRCVSDSISIALQQASAAAALCVTQAGAIASIPDAQQVKNFLETHSL